MGLICGIEDAGRGPVLGPMVMAGVLIEEEKEEELRALGVKDSKLLTAEKREELGKEIKRICKAWHAISVSPQEIDTALSSQQSNLNYLEAEKSAEIIKKLGASKVIIDCPSPNLDDYRLFIEKRVRSDTVIITEHRADLNYPVVSAASIIAKTIRDFEVAKLRERTGVDFGSGYMSDEKTKKFLDKCWESHKELFRTKWESYLERVRKKEQRTLGGF